jgi:hypothetical protein
MTIKNGDGGIVVSVAMLAIGLVPIVGLELLVG